LDSSQCPLSSHVVCAYIITNYKLLDGLEGNNKELFLKEELPPRDDDDSIWLPRKLYFTLLLRN
jgi:hypothetical protein